ncbi:MAG TPA: L-2-hydroxyglutarate oxidase [Acidimicrobiales bacterium]|nr:L-2-hydroxyglutarate oxidase [Acidimicrobiales bacterium]
MERVDVVVIGAGIVGLATARALLLTEPGLDVVVVEKEAGIARHQSGRNSNVLHSGIYYRPGSLKSRTVTAGRKAMIDYCRDRGIFLDVCGKVIVATEPEELPRLEALRERADAQGITAVEVDVRDHEPHAAGIAALHVPSAGIVDYAAVCEAMAEEVGVLGGRLLLSTPVRSIRGNVLNGDLAFRKVVGCAGLQSDRIARMTGAPDTGVRIMPFRGEYHHVVGPSAELVRNLIYPVPDPRFPFLGVHLTRDVSGGIHAGPNAVLALAREGYGWGTVRPRDLAAMARHRGTWRLARQHWRTGIDEVRRSLQHPLLVRALQRLVPDLRGDDLVPAPAGVRAQAVDRDGALLDDFVIEQTDTAVNVVNAPSPAATASLEIGRLVAERVLAGWKP